MQNFLVHVSLVLASRRDASDDSQENQRPCKRGGKRPVIEESSSSEGPNYEEEMEFEERGVHMVVSTRPRGSRRATYMPAPPQTQPNVDGRHIPLEAPQLHGRVLKDFTKVPKPAYLKFRRNVDQFKVVQDSLDQRFRTNVQADIYTSLVLPKGLSLPLH